MLGCGGRPRGKEGDEIRETDKQARTDVGREEEDDEQQQSQHNSRICLTQNQGRKSEKKT